MQFLGFLVSVLFYRGDVEIDGISVESNTVEKLVYSIENNYDEPRFTLADLQRSRFVRKGDVGKYFSNDLCDYVLYNNVSGSTEAIIITIEFGEESRSVYGMSDDASKPIVVYVPTLGNDKKLDEETLRVTAEHYINDFAIEHNINLKDKTVDEILLLEDSSPEIIVETDTEEWDPITIAQSLDQVEYSNKIPDYEPDTSIKGYAGDKTTSLDKMYTETKLETHNEPVKDDKGLSHKEYQHKTSQIEEKQNLGVQTYPDNNENYVPKYNYENGNHRYEKLHEESKLVTHNKPVKDDEGVNHKEYQYKTPEIEEKRNLGVETYPDNNINYVPKYNYKNGGHRDEKLHEESKLETHNKPVKDDEGVNHKEYQHKTPEIEEKRNLGVQTYPDNNKNYVPKYNYENGSHRYEKLHEESKLVTHNKPVKDDEGVNHKEYQHKTPEIEEKRNLGVETYPDNNINYVPKYNYKNGGHRNEKLHEESKLETHNKPVKDDEGVNHKEYQHITPEIEKKRNLGVQTYPDNNKNYVPKYNYENGSHRYEKLHEESKLVTYNKPVKDDEVVNHKEYQHKTPEIEEKRNLGVETYPDKNINYVPKYNYENGGHRDDKLHEESKLETHNKPVKDDEGVNHKEYQHKTPEIKEKRNLGVETYPDNNKNYEPNYIYKSGGHRDEKLHEESNNADASYEDVNESNEYASELHYSDEDEDHMHEESREEANDTEEFYEEANASNEYDSDYGSEESIEYYSDEDVSYGDDYYPSLEEAYYNDDVEHYDE